MRTVFVTVAMLSISTVGLAAGCPAFVAETAPSPWREDGPIEAVCAPFMIDGKPYLAVAYSNGGGGRFAVLSAGDEAAVVARSAEPLFDIAHSIAVRDLDGDGRPELMPSFLSRSDLVSWVFAFDKNQELRMISPSVDEDGPIMNAEIVDYDGDGRQEIVSRGAVKETDEDGLTVARPLYTLYILRDGVMAADPDDRVLHFSSHVRSPRQPEKETFDVHPPETGAYRVTLMNGNPDGSNRCSSGEVRLGRSQVFADRHFKQQVYRQTSDVQLQHDNLFEVLLRGAPGCEVAVMVDRAGDPNRN